jgi:ferredoxin
VCPVDAIFPADDVPGEWKEYTEINAKFFEEHTDAQGGASQSPYAPALEG